jgi:hypothetical protein
MPDLKARIEMTALFLSEMRQQITVRSQGRIDQIDHDPIFPNKMLVWLIEVTQNGLLLD